MANGGSAVFGTSVRQLVKKYGFVKKIATAKRR